MLQRNVAHKIVNFGSYGIMHGSLRSPGHTYKLEGKVTTVGRGSDGQNYHIPLTNDRAEKNHATIERLDKDNCYLLTDLNTVHGTYVNEHRVQNSTVRLSPGDYIRFGKDKTPYELEITNHGKPILQIGDRKLSSPSHCLSPTMSGQLSSTLRKNSFQPSRKGSSTVDDMSRSSSGLGTDSFNFRPDTAPTSPGDQTTRNLLGERSRSVPVNLKMSGKVGVHLHNLNTQLEMHDSSTASPDLRTQSSKEGNDDVREQPWYVSMLQEKEYRILMMGDEINRLSIHEMESRRKDNVIFELRKQLQESALMLQEIQNDPTEVELNQRLQLMGDEIARLAIFEEECEKAKNIASTLKHQLVNLEVENQALRMDKMSHGKIEEVENSVKDSTASQGTISPKEYSVYDQQLKSINQSIECATADVEALKQKFDTIEPEKLTPESEVIALKEDLASKVKLVSELNEELLAAHKEQSMTEGLVNALQKDVEIKENTIAKLTTKIYKAELRMNEAETQVRIMSKKFSDLKEEKKHSEMTTRAEAELSQLTDEYRNTILRMEKQQEKLDKQSREIRKLHRAQKQNAENERVQKTEMKDLNNNFDEIKRKEQLSRVAYEQISTRYDRLRSRIIQSVFTAPGAVRPENVLSDVEVFNAVQKIIEDRSEFHRQLEELNQEVPPLVVEIDSVTESERKEDITMNSAIPGTEKKSAKAGRKSPKHR